MRRGEDGGRGGLCRGGMQIGSMCGGGTESVFVCVCGEAGSGQVWLTPNEKSCVVDGGEPRQRQQRRRRRSCKLDGGQSGKPCRRRCPSQAVEDKSTATNVQL